MLQDKLTDVEKIDSSQLEVFLKSRQKKIILFSNSVKSKTLPLSLLKKYGSFANCDFVPVEDLAAYLYRLNDERGGEQIAGIKDIELAMGEILENSQDSYLSEIYRRPAYFSRTAGVLYEIYSSSLSDVIFQKKTSEKWTGLKKLSSDVREKLKKKNLFAPDIVYEKAFSVAENLKGIKLVGYFLSDLLKKEKDLIEAIGKNNDIFYYSELDKINKNIKIAPSLFPRTEINEALNYLSEDADKVKAGDCAIYIASYRNYVSALKDILEDSGLKAVYGQGLPLVNFKPVNLFISLMELIEHPLDVQPFLEIITHPAFEIGDAVKKLGLETKPSVASIREITFDLKKNRTTSDFRKKLIEISDKDDSENSIYLKIIAYILEVTEKLEKNLRAIEEADGYSAKTYKKLIDDCTRIYSEDEAVAMGVVKEVLDGLDESVKLLLSSGFHEDIIRKEIVSASTPGQSPSGENIYIDSLDSFVPGAFKRVAVIGLEDGVVPGKYGVDPLIFKEERAQLNQDGEILLEDEDLFYRRKKQLIKSLLFSGSDEIMISWPLNDPQTGEKNDVSRYLVDFLGEEKLEQNYESRMVLGLHENRFSWRRYKDDKDYKLLNSFFPLMSNFSKAIKGRYLEEENQFRAYLKEVPEDMVFSPSGLKKLFACSYGFLLDEIFKLKHFDYSERNVFEWLDPGTVGNLFHEIFYRTFAEGKASLVKIKEIADEEIKKARELLASPSEYAYQAFYKKMMAELEGFAEEGFIFEKDYKPEYFEVGVGTKRGKDPRKNFQDPVEYQGIKLKGVIDRIDSDGAGNFIIIDYKTGSLRKPKKDDEFLKGDHIQHVLYPIMFRKAFGDELAIEKISSGYYFSSRRAFFTQTHFKKHEEESRKSFDLFMEPFIEAYRKGEFFNNANKACRFCENKPVCNDAKVKKW